MNKTADEIVRELEARGLSWISGSEAETKTVWSRVREKIDFPVKARYYESLRELELQAI